MQGAVSVVAEEDVVGNGGCLSGARRHVTRACYDLTIQRVGSRTSQSESAPLAAAAPRRFTAMPSPTWLPTLYLRLQGIKVFEAAKRPSSLMLWRIIFHWQVHLK